MSRIFTPAGPPRFEHQRRGLLDIINNRGVHALLWDPGTGKTATTLDFCSLLALKAPSGEARVLVVAPLAAVDTWVQQAPVFVADGISLWAEAIGGSIRQRAATLASRNSENTPQKGTERAWKRAHALTLRGAPGADLNPADGPRGLGDDQPRLVLCALNLDTFASRSEVGSKTMADVVVDAVQKYAPDLVVVDESHRIKGAASNTSRTLSRLTRFVPRRIILTGTVMPHSPLDVYGQWRFLDPYAFGRLGPRGERMKATAAQFRERYAVLGGFNNKQPIGFKNLDHLTDTMALRSTVAKKSDVLDLPPVTETVVPVDLSPSEKKLYAEVKKALSDEIRAKGEGDASVNGLTIKDHLSQIMRLRQITSGHLPNDDGEVKEIGQSRGKVIRSLVHDTLTGESRVVIFAHFTHEIHLLQRLLAKDGTTVHTIDGSTPPQEREKIRAQFGSDDPARLVLIAQTRTMSLAVNELVTASHAIFASLPWQRDDVEQAIARLDRQGQTKPVTIWVTQAPGTVDEIVWTAIKNRTSVETSVLRHITGDGTEGQGE